MDEFNWVRDTPAASILTPQTKYYIPIGYGGNVNIIRDKFIELFGTDFSDNRRVNWFDNEHILQCPHDDIILLLKVGYSISTGIDGGWDYDCNTEHLVEVGYKRLEIDDFLSMVIDVF